MVADRTLFREAHNHNCSQFKKVHNS
jgi:hypothetical protein